MNAAPVDRLPSESLMGLHAAIDELEAHEHERTDSAIDMESLVVLLREKRYEDVLETLYRAQRLEPENLAVSRGIRLVKERLLGRYLGRLGNLDQVADRTAIQTIEDASHDELDVLRAVNGVASLSDILASCRLGRFVTARALASLLAQSAIVLLPPVEVTLSSPPSPSTATPEPEAPEHEVAPDHEVPSAPSADEAYAALFERGLSAYLDRNLGEALSIFEACLELRPDDRHARHNVERIRARLGG